ncbi:MAG: hypothetical protein WKF59_16335 [Chitinophagaceae bacterium]
MTLLPLSFRDGIQQSFLLILLQVLSFQDLQWCKLLLIITRKVLNLEDYITVGHIEAMNKVIVLTGSIVGCAYLTELFVAWYGQNQYEWWAFKQNRLNLFSPYGWAYYGMMFCNVVSPQLFWSRKLRRNIVIYFFHVCINKCRNVV